MTATDPQFTDTHCPMLGCHQPLHLVWTLSRPIWLSDLTGTDLPNPSDAYTASWRVECEEGHVLLLPDVEGMACLCGDDACNGSQGEGHADFDGSDDVRTFRAVDVKRLRELLFPAVNTQIVVTW